MKTGEKVEKNKLDKITWFNTNATWLYPIVRDSGANLGMDYLTMPKDLRFNEQYFVGYIYRDDKPLELVSYIQYRSAPNGGGLTLNYMEVADKYQGNGISKIAIENFSKAVHIEPNKTIFVTTFSDKGQKSNLKGKLEQHFPNNTITEVSKRDTMHR